MSKVSAIYHIVFATKNRRNTISKAHLDDLYRFLWNLIKENKCILYRIGGISNHVHMLIELNPNVALAALVRDLKSKSSGWLQKDFRFHEFDGWGREYFAATLSTKDKEGVIEYIKNQALHHNVTTFDDEIQTLCAEEKLRLFVDDLR